MGYINPAWQRGVDRFDEVSLFVDESAVFAQRGRPASFRIDLYGSWVLLTYAACQFSLDEIGRGCLEFLGRRYRYPRAMPGGILMHHQRMTLDEVRRIADRPRDNSLVQQLIRNIHSSEWSVHSSLLKMDRNVWPDNIREWLRRLGATDHDLKWMTEPVPGKTDTYESRNVLIGRREESNSSWTIARQYADSYGHERLDRGLSSIHGEMCDDSGLPFGGRSCASSKQARPSRQRNEIGQPNYPHKRTQSSDPHQ